MVNLVLDNNNLGNEGVCLLLRGLEKNSTLEVGYLFNTAEGFGYYHRGATLFVHHTGFAIRNDQQQIIHLCRRSFGLTTTE